MKIYNVCKKYEDHLVLDHLNMTLEEGKVYALKHLTVTEAFMNTLYFQN